MDKIGGEGGRGVELIHHSHTRAQKMYGTVCAQHVWQNSGQLPVWPHRIHCRSLVYPVPADAQIRCGPNLVGMWVAQSSAARDPADMTDRESRPKKECRDCGIAPQGSQGMAFIAGGGWRGSSTVDRDHGLIQSSIGPRHTAYLISNWCNWCRNDVRAFAVRPSVLCSPTHLRTVFVARSLPICQIAPSESETPARESFITSHGDWLVTSW